MKQDVFSIARKHLGTNQNGSDRHCMLQAIQCLDCGMLDYANRWALKSLAHSIGILSSDYARAWRMVHGSRLPISMP